jgi:cytochrome c-type biogenesis protein CcmE
VRAAAEALRAERARRTRRRLALVGLVLAGAIGFLLYKALSSGIVYFKTAAQAVADRTSLGNATFQIEGVVVPHSLHSHGASQTFAICSGPVHVPVHNVGSPPQLFESGVAVVLVGHFVGASDHFFSNQILVKHSSSYVAAHPGRVQIGDGQRC